MYVSLEYAIEIVLGLARENILTCEQAAMNEAEALRDVQIEACNVLEDFAVNQVDFDG